ncbi:hypothetical protein ACS0TY_005268 [Phlomoides rotata]
MPKAVKAPVDQTLVEERISNEGSFATTSTARPLARRKGRKWKAKLKDKSLGVEVIVPRHIHIRGRAKRSKHNSNTITCGRQSLDSTTFLHYFMNLWSAFPQEKVKSVAYFDPLWFNCYDSKNTRVAVLNWIKEKDIFSKKYVVVPIVKWSHWSLLIFCHLGKDLHSKINGPCMLLLDSLNAIGPTRLEPLIRRFLFDIYKSEDRPVSKQQLKKVPLLIPKVPQQKQGEECGFYVLLYINRFIERAPENFDQFEGYPYFMKRDWFSVEDVDSFCKSLDAFPVPASDHDSAASMDSVEIIDDL